jgi:hypothetical protein
LAVLLVFLLGSFTALAQGGSLGSVAGVVKDTSGAAIAGATVTLKNNGTGDTKTATTSNEGSFHFALINNGSYTVSVDKEGFKTANYTDVSVLPGQQYSLVATLQVGARSESVEVVAGQDIINTTTSEIAGSVTQSQMINLPLLGRNPIELMRGQAGVQSATNREDTGINGGRPGWTQITQDGINIQDNFIRNNATDFVPTRPTSDTIGEFSVITAVAGADSVGGSSQVRLVTPSGTNSFHGAVYEYNRNSALSAYNFFSKRVTPVPAKPFLNQNQFGARLGGPVIKNKLFFWGSYEGFRLRQTALTSLIVPANADYVTGTYRYVSGTTVVPVNVLAMINANMAAKRAAGTTTLPDLVINPLIQSQFLSQYSTNGNSLACGDSTATSIRNTTCDQFNQSNPQSRNQESFRIDYNMTSKHTLQFNYQRFYDASARTDIDNVNPATKSSISTKQNLFSGAWRWTISNRFLNEFRAGDLTSVVPFLRGYPDPVFLFGPAANNAATLTGLGLTAPITNFRNQGRNVTTRQYMDNASYTWGSHNLQFGGGYQGVQPHPYNYASTTPTVTVGFSSGSLGLTGFNSYNLAATGNPAANFPAGQTPTQTQLNAINAYAAFLAGAVSSQSQSFQAKDVNSGFVNGYPNVRAFSYSIWSSYLKDEWRLKPNITLTLGLKYEYWTPVNVGSSLALLPVVAGNDLKGALLNPNGSVASAGTLWKPDRNQFAPSVGVAWSWNPKTVIRAGYAMNFVNEDSVTAASNAINGNSGLVGSVNQTSLGYLLTGTPVIPTPAFTPNRTYSQLVSTFGFTSAAFGIQPNLRTPSEHSLSFGVQRELGWNSALEVRYVGTFSRDLWRGVDYNQNIAAANLPFLADFLRARSNGFLALNTPVSTPGCTATTCAVFNPAFNAVITGSVPLTFFPTLDLGGNLTNTTVRSNIQTGQIGALVDTYVTARGTYPNAPNLFLPNPNIYAADAIINGGRLNYNSLQVEFRRRNVHGFSFQANYTYSKDLSDTYGDSQNRFEPLLDNARPGLNYSRSPFDLNHVFNSSFVYELPFGQGKRFLGGAHGVLDKIVGGWSTATIFRWQSGSPFSIGTGGGYQTFQRRSTDVMAVSTLSVSQIKKLIHISTVNGITYWIDPKVIASNGTAVGPDGQTYTPTFAGQVFYNPQPNSLGSFTKLQFSSPSTISWDASAKKAVKFWEAHPIVTTFAADFFNATNSQFYYVGDANINSSTFGRTSSRAVNNRIIQMSLRIDF